MKYKYKTVIVCKWNNNNNHIKVKICKRKKKTYFLKCEVPRTKPGVQQFTVIEVSAAAKQKHAAKNIAQDKWKIKKRKFI